MIAQNPFAGMCEKHLPDYVYMQIIYEQMEQTMVKKKRSSIAMETLWFPVTVGMQLTFI